MKLNRHFPSLDLKTRPPKKIPDLLPRAKQVDPNQRCTRYSRNSKDSNLYTQQSNALRNAYPSIETTGIPLNSGPDEPVATKPPSYDEKKFIFASDAANRRKGSLNQVRLDLKKKRDDVFSPITSIIGSRPNFSDPSDLEAFARDSQIFQNSLNLSLSAIKGEEESKQEGVKGAIKKVESRDRSFGLGLSLDGLIDDPEYDRKLFKQGFYSIDVSAICAGNGRGNDLELETLDAILLPDVVLDLDVSKIQFEKEIMDIGEMDMEELFLIPKEFKNVKISCIEVEEKFDESADVKDMLKLLGDKEFSLEIELSIVQAGESLANNSDIEAIEEFLLTDS